MNRSGQPSRSASKKNKPKVTMRNVGAAMPARYDCSMNTSGRTPPPDTRLAVERRRLAGKIANRDAELGVVVDIGGIDTHPGIGRPPFIQHQPRLHPDFAKRAIALIDKEQTGREIVGHQDVGPAVIVVIDDRNAEHARLWRHNASP